MGCQLQRSSTRSALRAVKVRNVLPRASGPIHPRCFSGKQGRRPVPELEHSSHPRHAWHKTITFCLQNAISELRTSAGEHKGAMVTLGFNTGRLRHHRQKDAHPSWMRCPSPPSPPAPARPRDPNTTRACHHKSWAQPLHYQILPTCVRDGSRRYPGYSNPHGVVSILCNRGHAQGS